MAVREYNSPNPKTVVENLRFVLASGDMTKLQKPAYTFLITHCGFIAHYDLHGFIATYQDHMTDFVDLFLSQLGMGWNTFLDNPQSYLYDTKYKGVYTADVVRELILLFQQYKASITALELNRDTARKERALFSLAEELGYTITKREGPDA